MWRDVMWHSVNMTYWLVNVEETHVKLVWPKHNIFWYLHGVTSSDVTFVWCNGNDILTETPFQNQPFEAQILFCCIVITSSMMVISFLKLTVKTLEKLNQSVLIANRRKFTMIFSYSSIQKVYTPRSSPPKKTSQYYSELWNYDKAVTFCVLVSLSPPWRPWHWKWGMQITGRQYGKAFSKYCSKPWKEEK